MISKSLQVKITQISEKKTLKSIRLARKDLKEMIIQIYLIWIKGHLRNLEYLMIAKTKKSMKIRFKNGIPVKNHLMKLKIY